MSNIISDINEETGCRLPLPDREALDGEGKIAYDRLADRQDGALMGLKGPTAMTLHSPAVNRHQTSLNNYLRFDASFGGAIRELVILVAAREMDSRFEWAAHESEALKEGVPAEVVDVVKFRKKTDGLGEDYANLIEYGRSVMQGHAVSPDLFARLNGAYGSKGVTDLAFLLGNYVSLAIFLATIDSQVPEDNRAQLPVS
jgi:4-carboxymuconolactone decarboxylase